MVNLADPAGYLNERLWVKGTSVRRLSQGGYGMTTVVNGLIRGTGSEVEMAVTPDGSQLLSQSDAAYQELTRQGQMWATMQTAAVAALVVRPTTVTGIEIWNGSATLSLVVDRLFSQNLVTSTTALGGGAQIWAMVSLPVNAGPSVTALTIVGASGKAYSGGVKTGVGTTVVANGWFPWGICRMRESAGSVVPGGGLVAEVNGRIIVPPFCSLCVTTVSGYVADTFCNGASWYERAFAGPNNPLL